MVGSGEAAAGTAPLAAKAAAGFAGGSVGGLVESGAEQAIRVTAGEQSLTMGDVTTRMAAGGALEALAPVASEVVGRIAQKLTKSEAFELQVFAEQARQRRNGGSAEYVTEIELPATHHVKAGKGVPSGTEFSKELKGHAKAMQDILDDEKMAGLQARILESRANRSQLNQLSKEINESLGSAGPGKAWSHWPDKVIGADPFAIHGTADQRINSIIGAASKQWADALLGLDPKANYIIKLKIYLFY